MFKVEFQGKNEEHEEHYTNCFVAIAVSSKQLSVAEWDDVIELIRKLKAIGRDTGEKLNGSPVYVLKDEGGSVELERSEMTMLKDFVKQPIWRPMNIEKAKATLAWLDSHKKD